MAPTEVKQAADEMVEVFRPYAYAGIFQQDPFLLSRDQECNATRIAIAHCKRIINEITWWHDTTSYETTMDFEGAERRINHYRLILSELEGRVK